MLQEAVDDLFQLTQRRFCIHFFANDRPKVYLSSGKHINTFGKGLIFTISDIGPISIICSWSYMVCKCVYCVICQMRIRFYEVCFIFFSYSYFHLSKRLFLSIGKLSIFQKISIVFIAYPLNFMFNIMWK